ncbi:sigma-70 family RNA polymerase sigma factor [Fimbriiglobus ruber]|uniref:Thioredoxin domain-containing protein n=1 Tax=Fimbriiglobus ruber TaxID=1908690 RepID=A0A225DPJ6_9BACT|nr:sigma-70 family RNA polymerase sigma factor [Fimbriiglobus ruber]OWK43221.1 hypothetical protein FRUB_02820 [Fimbriiglobus ruber]
MPDHSLSAIAAGRPDPLGQTADADLLARFAATGDGTAFELLVWRYQRLVYGVCLRVLGHAHDAEDAAQAAFLVLARRADGVRRPAALGGWLARVAYRCAVRVRTRRPDDMPPLPDVPATAFDADAAELSAALDDELNHLPDKYRVALVLCCLQGMTYQQAARLLGCPLGTLSGWVTRGKDLLRARLVRRGITLSAAGWSAYLAEVAAGAADTVASVAGVTRAALGFACQESVTPSARAISIANGVLRMMTLKTVAAATLAGVVAMVGLVGAVALAAAPRAGEPKDKPPTPSAVRPIGKEKTDVERLQGEWIFDAAEMPGIESATSALPWVWESRWIFKGDEVLLTKFAIPYSPGPHIVPELKAGFKIDPTKSPKTIDLTRTEPVVKLLDPTRADGLIQGIYQFLDNDTVRVCLESRMVEDHQRPTTFDIKGRKDRILFTIKRSRKPGTPTPKDATIEVFGPDAKPVEGAVVSTMIMTQLGEKEPTATSPTKTGAGGTATVPVNSGTYGHLFVRSAERKLAGFVICTPASLVNSGRPTVTLMPECRVPGSIVCSQLSASAPTLRWTSVSILRDDYEYGRFISSNGHFDFPVPPGKYTLLADGTYYTRTRKEVTVAAGQTELAFDRFDVPANDLGKLIGKPAPPLKNIKGWKGDPVSLTDLKGKTVLLMFWVDFHAKIGSYSADWMAQLHDFYNLYKDRGLEVIVVVVDRDKTIDTAEGFATRVKENAKTLKRSPDALTFPFRVALLHNDPKFAGRNGLVVGCETMADYGVSYPIFPVLIDKKGNVAGQMYPRDVMPTEEHDFLEKILGGK